MTYVWFFALRKAFSPSFVLPLSPRAFRHRAEDLQFTHRADLAAVLHSQQLVFQQRMAATENVDVAALPLRQIPNLLELVPLYESLCVFTLEQQHLTPAQGEALLQRLVVKPRLRKLRLWHVPLACGAVQVLRDGLADNEAPVQELSLVACALRDSCVQLLAEGAAASRTQLQLDLSRNFVGDRGATALAHAVQARRELAVILNLNCIRKAGVLALGEAVLEARVHQAGRPAASAELSMNPIDWTDNDLQEYSWLSRRRPVGLGQSSEEVIADYHANFPLVGWFLCWLENLLAAVRRYLQRLCFGLEQIRAGVCQA